MKKTVLIEGMSCMHCASHVKKALSAFDPHVEVSLEDKRALLETAAGDDEIIAAVKDAGYEVVGIR